MLYPRVKQMIEEALPVQVLGYVPVLKECVLESRHLGLVMPDEIKDIQEKLKELAKVLEKTLDVDGLISLAKDAPEIRPEEPKLPRPVKEAVRVAVARDAAFCFLYEDNLRLLEKLGANVVEFSPLEEEKLPEADGLLLPGGYPELYAKQLNENASMRRSIREAIKQGMPCMAECGGFMYLHEQMEDMEGKTYEMAGVIQGKAYYTGKLGRFGYITLQEGSIFGKEAGAVPAHEFHYFDSENCGEAFDAEKPKSSRSWKCMHSTDTILAGFPHLYYYGYPRTAAAFLEKCLERKRLR